MSREYMIPEDEADRMARVLMEKLDIAIRDSGTSEYMLKYFRELLEQLIRIYGVKTR